jgi:alpha-L-arabinofuranosidase
VMPEYFMGAHASVYDNSLQYTGSAAFNQLDGLLDAAGVNVLRYPGGGYADVFHFSVSRSNGGITGYGLSPWWGQPTNYGYMGPKTDFGNFVKLLDATNSETVITVNTGSAIKYTAPGSSQMAVPTHNGQPQEAAAWVAYANADASLYGTPNDIVLGVDAEGNNWRTAGYWAKLRASTPAEYSTWANSAGIYDSRNAFLAIDRDAPVGIKYWEIGNENFGTSYYGGAPGDHGYALNYAAPYDGSARDDNPALSPAAYGAQFNSFNAAMKAVDPTIKTGAVLTTPRTDANTPIGDYTWSYADLNNNGIKEANEPYWNDEVLSHTDAHGKVADNANFVIAHWYPNGTSNTIVNEPRITIPVMINGTTAGLDSGSNAGLRDSIARWRSDGNGNAAEIYITETDGYGGSVEASDGLFAADAYATFLDNGVSNVDWLELHGGSFLNDSNAPNFAYWGIQSVHKLAEAGDELVATSSTDSNVRIHASVQDDGSVAVMILNMNTTNRTVNVSINGNTLSVDGVMYQTNGDTALSLTSLSNLGNSFSTSIAGHTLQVFVISALSGDFNHDNIIDAADYIAWRKSDSSPAGYTLWRAHFGQTTGSGMGTATSTAVPEPSLLVLLMFTAPAWCLRRDRAA